jgi:hypothetical protein
MTRETAKIKEEEIRKVVRDGTRRSRRVEAHVALLQVLVAVLTRPRKLARGLGILRRN